MRILVTPVSNIQKNEKGQPLLDDDGNIQLIDEDDSGILTKTHIVSTTLQDPVTGNLQAGLSSLCEVYWDMQRSPAPALVAPADLFWLQDLDDSTDVEDDEDDDEDDETDGDDQGVTHY